MNIASKILSNQDRDGMLRRSLERIIQLYTDKSHFVYELLQNAEDSGASGIRFVQYPDRLEVMHDGHAFTTENLQGLCDIGQSDKVNNLNQIGEFGVGFKSVFGICDKVRLYSRPRPKEISDNCQPFAIEIQDFTRPVDIASVDIPAGYTTLFVFPYSVGFTFSGFKSIKLLNEALTKRLKNLGVTTLLFMHSLSLIEYEVKIPGEYASGQYMLDEERINDHCTEVSAIESEDKKTDESLSFIKFSMPIAAGVSNRTIDIAFTVVKDKNGRSSFQKAKNPYISVYFPTETESKLGFIVQGPFRTTPNRSSVPADDDENIALAEKMAQLLRRSILELRDMGRLDLSLLKILPLDEDDFWNYSLFMPLYEETENLFSSEAILPTNDGKTYIDAQHALITRSKELIDIFPNELITELYADGKEHVWLPFTLTETGPYKDVLSYLRRQIGIEVVEPEDLRSHFNENTQFIRHRKNEWLIRLYKFYETVPNIFMQRAGNILDAIIIRTASNNVVAPYRRSEGSYIPNVFLPSKKLQATDVEIVHPELYEKCRSFFEGVLHLKAPNEYEYFVKALQKKYSAQSLDIDPKEHIQDVQIVIRYLQSPEYADDMRSIVKENFMIRCRQGNKQVWAHPFRQRILFPQSESGIMLEWYYKGISDDIIFVDYDMYQSAGFSFSDIRQLGVSDNILTGLDRTWGEYQSGNPGRQPEWRTSGDFRWKLSIDRIEDVLNYISKNPAAKDSLIKSQVIFRILQENIHRLVGTVWIGGQNVPHKYDEPADIIRILNNEGFNYKLMSWNGRWVYTESKQLVSHRDISKHDLNKSLYGKVSLDSNLYDLLGFKKGKIDQYEAVVKDYDALPEEKKQSYFEIELQRRYGITPDDLLMTYGNGQGNGQQAQQSEEEEFEFPTGNIKNWDALRKHAAQILSYASPVKYERVVRSIRVSRPQDDVRAYLMNMYRVNSSYRYACQLCHKPFANVEMCQLERKPDVELDPLNLCLCPSCAQRFRELRNSEYDAQRFIEEITSLTERDISGDDYVSVAIRDMDFWFTQTHIAEIVELLRLKKQADDERKKPGSTTAVNIQPMRQTVVPIQSSSQVKPVKQEAPFQQPALKADENEEDLQSDLSVYREYIGKRVFHRTQKAYAKVVDCDGTYFKLQFESGVKAGQTVSYSMAMCIDNGWLEIVE